MKYPYKQAILRDYAGDLAKRWYVEFYVWDIAVSKLERKRDYDLNAEKTDSARREKADVIIKAINDALKKGYVFDSSKAAEKKKQQSNSKSSTLQKQLFLVAAITGESTLKEAVRHFQKVKSEENGKRSEQAYNTLKTRLFAYLKSIDNAGIALKYVNTTFLENFSNYLRVEYQIHNNTTINSYIQMIKAVFNHYHKREIITKNPTKNLDYLQTTVSDKHLPYTDRQARYVMQYIKETDPQLYLFCNFVYFSFIRPKELRYLKVSHLACNPGHKKIIRVPSLTEYGDKLVRHSKNRKTGYVRMLPGLEKLINEFGILDYPPEHFIFNKDGKPAAHPVSANFFNARYRKVLNELGFSKDYTLYSWKHTGAVNLYEATHDMKLIQMQCRHADIKTTDSYLRGLTLIGNFDHIDLPGF